MAQLQPHILDRRARQEAQSREEAIQRRIDEARRKNFAWLMNQPEGRAIVWWLLEMCAVFDSAFDTNALIMARTAGRKELGGIIWGMINETCPEQYVKMAIEQNKVRNEQ